MAAKTKGKFTKAGDVSQKTVWNSAKTRKWEMTYKLVEVKPAKKSRAKKTEEPRPKAVAKAKNIIAKSKKALPKKKTAKRKKA